MSRYGLMISQQGIDISRAADYQMVLDSNWKFFNILEELYIDFTSPTFSGANGYKALKLYDHNLGHTAAFEFIPSQKTGGNIDVLESANAVVAKLLSDRDSIYLVVLWTGAMLTSPLTIRGRLRVFSTNILEEYEAPAVPLGPMAPAALEKYGAKFTNRANGSTRIDDESIYPFSLNTRGKQISLHKHGVAEADGTGRVTVLHNVGYPPTYMIARVKDPSFWGTFYANPFPNEKYTLGPLLSTPARAKATNTDIVFRGAQSALVGKYAYVILKDPAEIAG